MSNSIPLFIYIYEKCLTSWVLSENLKVKVKLQKCQTIALFRGLCNYIFYITDCFFEKNTVLYNITDISSVLREKKC